MPTRIPILSRVEPQPPAGEVEHLEGVVGAFGVAEEHGMPLTAMRTTDLCACLQGSRFAIHQANIANAGDSAGQPL